MNDDYMHLDNNIIYTAENIPGPIEDSDEYKELFNNFNSQVSHHCTCGQVCEINTCNCIQKSGGYNYGTYTENGRLKLKLIKAIMTYPTLECNSGCSCSANCGNRLIQKGPLKGLYIKSCDVPCKGFGLFTTDLIPNGTFICEYAGELLTKFEAENRIESIRVTNRRNYIFCLREVCQDIIRRTFIDPSFIGNIGRYINHSCEPNCLIMPVRIDIPTPKIAIFSCVDIMPGAEITMHYGSSNISHPEECSKGYRRVCSCESQGCKGFMPCESF